MKEIKEIQALGLHSLVETPTLIMVKSIRPKIVDKVEIFKKVPEHDPVNGPRVKIVGRIQRTWIVFEMFHDDPTNRYLGKVREIDYFQQLASQILAASVIEETPEIRQSAQDQAGAYIDRKIPELFAV